ncbi:glucan endo-1,3-beta-D-glucosidase [Geosmithia morbida]|uniref:Glucan endo-1,3-beta-D-glucosidase n=1 Tax=Geosmithia morbida TaxID=1094350 RepID=A0A9P5D863_9HYPO|nr:glucan endo-1,3-beta-D-glucosidase [Geosmithia morbida]KAF4126470.1 glucan endo-1,3-beta-D-glucosidase [Geosmithia morbida]
MRFTSAVASGLAAVGAAASTPNYLGFNSGSTQDDRSAKFKSDFLAEFKTAANLKNSPGDFNSVRLYTNIQAYSTEDPIQAFDAAVETETNILLGVWASGTDSIDKEVTALKKAIANHGSKLTDLVIGVNIGSEDLYRTSQTGIENESGVGAGPDTIVNFINDWKKAFKGTALADTPVGHADTWDAWTNGTNKAVIDAVDFLSVHEYPYYEGTKDNDISNAADLFETAYEKTLAVAGDKPVWVTETGWPYVGPKWERAVASVANAKKYWQDVGCKKLFNKTPTFWYTLRDANPDNTMKFAITDELSTTPRWDLSCPTTTDDDDNDDDNDNDNDNDDDDSLTSTSTSSSSKATETVKSGSDEVTSSVSKPTSSSDSSSGSATTTATATSGSDSSSSSNEEQAASTPVSGSSSETPVAAASTLKVSAVGIVAVIGGLVALF